MKYLPNFVTLFRVILTVVLNVYLFLDFGEILVPLILTAMIFFSDFADGWLARKYNSVTKFGVGFDAFADILYVVLTYAVLYGYHVLPLVGLILILLKFLEFVVTSAIMNTQKTPQDTNGLLIFDHLGKAVGILFYITPITTYVIHQQFINYNHSIHIAIAVVIGMIGAMALVSTWHRIGNCLKTVEGEGR